MSRQSRIRALKYGSNAAVAALLVLGLLVVINLLAGRYRYRLDTTKAGEHSLSDQTVTLLDSLRKDVHVLAFFREKNRPPYEELLSKYGYQTGRFTYRFIDPDKNPILAKENGVRMYGTSLIRVGERQDRIRSTGEEDLTNAIARAVRERSKVIYFLSGHGETRLRNPERDGYSRVLEALREKHHVVRDSFFLAGARSVPEDCDLLVVAGPKTGLFQTEADSIRHYLEGGGSGFFLLDPGVNTGLEPLLDKWAISVNDDHVVDGSGLGRLFGLDLSMPVAAEYASHPVSVKHKGLRTFYMLARSVTQSREAPSIHITPLVKTSGAAWREMDGIDTSPVFDKGRDIRGPISLAMAVQALPRRPVVRSDGVAQQATHIVVFGDSDFATNQFFDTQGNGDLFLNAVSWLLEERDMIAIRPRTPAFSPITLRRTDSGRLFWICLFLVPAVPVIIGIAVWRRRRMPGGSS